PTASGSAQRIGVGMGSPPPALRTVQAVFPHTALQSVVSSSRLSRSGPGCVKCEQPVLCEVGIGPQPTATETLPDVRPLHPLLQQQGSQPTPDRSVDGLEDMRMGMLEVAEPAAQRPI